MIDRSRRKALIAVPAIAMLAGTGIAVGLHACGGGGNDEASGSTAAPAAPQAGRFPVRIAAGERHLVDASGTPFLLQADTAWSLIAELSKADAEAYLEDRRQKGFNAIIVNLLEHKFATNAPNNHDGQPPFTTPGDYATPNPDYFAHADYIIKLAEAKGILVLLVPSYLGYNGGDEGWYAVMQSNAAKMLYYGRFLGQRYMNYRNIMWVHGGDFNPPLADKQLVRDIARGIKAFDSASLHTVHCGPETSALDYWSGETWLDVNSIYTWINVSAKVQAAYVGSSMPFFLLESRYENEHTPPVGQQGVRVEAYQAMLAGAMGQTFGNNPMWHFDAPGVFPNPSPPNWQAWLDSPGAKSMAHLRTLLSAYAWWTLVPDSSHTLLTSGFSSSDPFDVAAAAKAKDSSFALIYVPSARTVTVDLTQIAGSSIAARWFDPSAGTFAPVGGSPFLTSGPRSFPTPGSNASAATDWVLVLESAS